MKPTHFNVLMNDFSHAQMNIARYTKRRGRNPELDFVIFVQNVGVILIEVLGLTLPLKLLMHRALSFFVTTFCLCYLTPIVNGVLVYRFVSCIGFLDTRMFV